MSTADTPPLAPDGARKQPPPTRATRQVEAGAPLPRRSGGGLVLALLLALLAILGAGYVGWRQWQLAQGGAASSAGLARLEHRVATLESAMHAADSERGGIQQQLTLMVRQNQGMSAQVPALQERTQQLEGAVATLAERTQSGREPMLLDETESLLRMAVERYRLFHDSVGAVKAYDLADQTLAAVDDGAFNQVRQAIRSERDALARSQPENLDDALQQLQELRGRMPTFPLKPADDTAATGNDRFWARVGRALASVIHVQRDDGGPLALQDARFARELAVLDLAQAQTALLAHDGKAYAGALQRADTSLTTQFDQAAPAVQQAHTLLKQLDAMAPTGAPVQLGQALSELRSLRAVHALQPASASSVPGAVPVTTAPAGSSQGIAHGGARS